VSLGLPETKAMRNDRKELLNRFYLQLELMCAQADQDGHPAGSQRIGDLYDDQAPTVWGSRSGGPFVFSLPG
jgi:hypothetical protein